MVAFVVGRRSFNFKSDRRVAARGREFISVCFLRLVSSILHLLLLVSSFFIVVALPAFRSVFCSLRPDSIFYVSSVACVQAVILNIVNGH